MTTSFLFILVIQYHIVSSFSLPFIAGIVILPVALIYSQNECAYHFPTVFANLSWYDKSIRDNLWIYIMTPFWLLPKLVNDLLTRTMFMMLFFFFFIVNAQEPPYFLREHSYSLNNHCHPHQKLPLLSITTVLLVIYMSCCILVAL